jgi:hypothetical protein
MRQILVPLLAIASTAVACKRHATPATDFASAQRAPIAAEPSLSQPVTVDTTLPARGDLRGKVTEKIDVNQYSYLELDGKTWAAVPKTDVAVGQDVTITGAMWMENFKSATLDRTWPRIAFGTLQTADVGDVKVPRARGAQGHTIAEIYQQRAQLKERSVEVRGKVVKATNGVLGKNWLHLRDGSGQGPTADLPVASVQTATVGQTVVISGIVHLDRDLGAGYHYDVIVEDASLKAE